MTYQIFDIIESEGKFIVLRKDGRYHKCWIYQDNPLSFQISREQAIQKAKTEIEFDKQPKSQLIYETN